MSAVVVGFGPYRSSSALMRRQDMAAMTQVFVELVADVRRKVARRVRSLVSKWSPSAYRLGFKIDIVGYGLRVGNAAKAIVKRMFALIEKVQKDLKLEFETRDEGDAVTALLPPSVTTEVLPRLLDALVERLREDNDEYRDRLRVRMSVGLGTAEVGPRGAFDGELMVELSRLNESAVLRDAVTEFVSSDLVVAISDKVGDDAMRAGWAPAQIRQVTVKVKEYARPAWLWASELESR